MDRVTSGTGGTRTGGVASGGLATGGSGTTTGGLTTGGVASGGTTSTASSASTGPVRLAWTNPLVPQRADPYVLLHSDGYYYLAATVPEYDRIELRRATSLAGLSTAQAKIVWRKHTTGEMGAHIWAPEIHFIDNAWYIYFTAGRANDIWAIRMYALKSTAANPLDGDWTELGRITTNWDSFSLDATTFAHAGQRYYLWTQEVPNYPGTSILIARMSSPTTLTGAQVVLSSPQLAWETRGIAVNEAPAVLVKSGKIFVTYSASATDQNYCMGLLTADAGADLLDPKSWKKPQQPVFQTSTQNSQYGPGHNSFTTTPDGRVDILVYHARKYRDITGEALNNPDRATRAQHLPFDASGMPVFGAPVADGPYQADVLP
jgi:GH43 family beta-xylosidase